MGADIKTKRMTAATVRPQWSWQGCEARPLVWLMMLFLMCSMGVIGFLVPALMVNILLWCFSVFIVFMACFRILAVLITSKGNQRPNTPDHISGSLWPSFTVLVPLYKEAHMVANLVKYLMLIDYPPHLLNVILVAEQDDEQTCLAVKRNLRPHIQLFEVPPSQPRTKPKALNAALAGIPKSSCGDIITVYDAEDRPHPDQIKQAAQAFMADPELAVVQAPLGYFNDQENILTALFGLEYAALFHVWNPALARLGLPFTLGGTSNHIRREVLERCGGWDAHNVTEDADLSFRIFALNHSRQKFKIGTITAPTGEESVNSYTAWSAQRSRWLKGFMQTWRVHMRFQKRAPDGKEIQFATRMKNLLSLQITVGATLLAAFLHLPSLIIMSIIYLKSHGSLFSTGIPTPLLCTVILGYSAAILTGIIGAVRAMKPHLVKHVIFMPFYWMLYFWPALIAVFEIIFAPAYWRKTTHIGAKNVDKNSNKQRTRQAALEPTNGPLI